MILEDVPTDAELMKYELTEAGMTFSSRRVAVKATFLKELEEFSPDIILSDYSLPSFDGLSALKIAVERYPDLPFIFVSGALGEERAIELLKKGATDYVLKDRLLRLAPAVSRALQEAKEKTERKRAENALKESEVRYRTIFENTGTATIIIDENTLITLANRQFEELSSAYGGNTALNAAEFQRALVNHIIVGLRAKNGGRLIIHSHDWMAGGIITAYAKLQGCPVLHTLHNVHTGYIPRDMLFGIDTGKLSDCLYLSENHGNLSIDCQATAIKNASLVSFVGKRFLSEIVDNHFSDQPIISPSVRQEVRVKCDRNAVLTILNAPARNMYPEKCDALVRKYGPDDDFIAAKRENLAEFQKRTGLVVNPEAILLYWPSRLDPSQKGIELLEAIAHKFVIAHDDAQIAIVGNGVGNDRIHEDICGRIAWSSGGKIAYQRFNEPLSMLGFAAASDVFGASLYEPCGQIDQVGNLFGATSTNRDTGGYHDKIRELTLIEDGAPGDSGNGFLFRDYDTGGLWYGLDRTVQFHRRPLEIRARQIKRIMKETRQQHDIELMIEKYIDAYERLNGGIPLA